MVAEYDSLDEPLPLRRIVVHVNGSAGVRVLDIDLTMVVDLCPFLDKVVPTSSHCVSKLTWTCNCHGTNSSHLVVTKVSSYTEEMYISDNSNYIASVLQHRQPGLITVNFL
jgi:hypothetical protein